MTPSLARLALIATIALASVACASGSERERQSAADVARAEETIRNADNSAKRSALGLLSAPCVAALPCEAQRLCREAYTLHVEAFELTQAAKQAVETDPTRAASLLGPAQQKLAQARTQVATCTERVRTLRHDYKL